MGQAARLPLPETETQMTGRLAARPTKLRVPHGIAGRRARQCFIDVQRAKTLAGKPPAPPEKPSRRCPTGAQLESPGKSVQIHPPKPQPGRNNPAGCVSVGASASGALVSPIQATRCRISTGFSWVGCHWRQLWVASAIAARCSEPNQFTDGEDRPVVQPPRS